MSLDIRSVTAEGLLELATAAGGDGGTVPISKSRARAWANNPNVRPQDTVLLVAREGSEITGFVGWVPGRVSLQGTPHPISWLSTWYASPASRAVGTGFALLLRARSLRPDLAVTPLRPHEARRYEKLGFKSLGVLRYSVLDLRKRDLHAAPLRLLRRIERSARLQDRTTRLVDLASRRRKRRVYSRALAELPATATVPVVLPDQPFLEKFKSGLENEAQRVLRGPREIEWMLRFPWVANSSEERSVGYYFGDFDPDFRYYPSRALLDGSEVAAAVYHSYRKHTNLHLVLLDYWLEEGASPTVLLSVALDIARDIAADRVVVPQHLGEAAKGTLLARTLEVGEREYLRNGTTRSPLAGAESKITFHLADGPLA